MQYLSALLEIAERRGDDQDFDTFRFRAVTASENRLGYRISPSGWQLDGFRQNPVFLADHHGLPIGRVTSIEPGMDGLAIEVLFDDADPVAQQIRGKYQRGFLHAVSVGFLPLKTHPGTAGEPPTINSQELLEVSAVSVPADPGALRMSAEGGASAELLDQIGLAIARNDVETLHKASELMQRFPPPLLEAVALLGAIGSHTTAKADEGAAWDAGAQVRQAEGAAALRRMHAWVDGEGDPEAKTSYKLPHHQASGAVVWRGVAAAMGRLMQAGTQVPDGDRRGVYAHLAAHYRQFDKEPPTFQAMELVRTWGTDQLADLLILITGEEAASEDAAQNLELPPLTLDLDLSALTTFAARELPAPGKE